MVAVHPLAFTAAGEAHMGAEPLWDLSLFGGQGSATIGPPIFMHRASSPGPKVPRNTTRAKTHTRRFRSSARRCATRRRRCEASAFSAGHLGPQDSRFYPHPGAPDSFAARVRHVFARAVEVQISGERLHGHDEPSAWQASASAYAWGTFRDVRVDALLDWAMDRPQRPHRAQRARRGGGPLAHRRSITWMRTEVNQRVEPTARPCSSAARGCSRSWVSNTSPWCHGPSGIQLGLFGEAKYRHIPSELSASYGRCNAVALSAGLHLFGMWMLDGSFRRLTHHTHSPAVTGEARSAAA